jgi:nucleoside-diphosphate-sugar epimerase
MSMKIFMTGAGGYLGGSLAARLIEEGHTVHGLVRDEQKGELLRARGIHPVLGSLDDADVLLRGAQEADAVISAASADHESSLHVFVGAMEGTGKLLMHTSGSSVVGDDVRGDMVSESIFDEDTPFVVRPTKQPRHELNQRLLAASARGVRTVIVCPSLVYGVGAGLNTKSIQIPFLLDQAQASGVVRVIGRGLNRWSTVHIDDLTALYSLALAKAPPGSFYFAENGESSFAELGEALAQRLASGSVQSWDAEVAAEKWGVGMAYYTLGSNSRVRGKRARKELGWAPSHSSARQWILDDMPL